MYLNSLYIIIVTFNGQKWIRKCIESCADYNIIVVDNNSSDSTREILMRDYPNVELIQQDDNLGFGKANNIGIKHALDNGAEYVFLLNQDAYLCDDVLDKLVRLQNEFPDYGVLSPIHLSNEKNMVDFKFMNYISHRRCPKLVTDFLTKKNLKDIYDVNFINAAAWLVSKECLKKIGGFDPLFYHYGEDNNFCQRVIYHGLKIGVVPNAYIIHDRTYSHFNEEEIDSNKILADCLKNYKVQFANINDENALNKLKNHKKSLVNRIVKKILTLNYREAHFTMKKLKELKKSEDNIQLSFHKNKEKGQHYII